MYYAHVYVMKPWYEEVSGKANNFESVNSGIIFPLFWKGVYIELSEGYSFIWHLLCNSNSIQFYWSKKEIHGVYMQI